jgi:hypothetical protein
MPKSIAGIVAIGCLLPTLLQAADSLHNAFNEISEQLIAQLPKGQTHTLALAPIRHNVDQCSELSFYALERFSAQLFRVGGTKVDIVLRHRLESLLEEHKISKLNPISLKDQKRLGQLATISAMVIGSITELGQMFEFIVNITDIETGKAIATAYTKFPASSDVKTLMKRKKKCTYTGFITPNPTPGTHVDDNLPTPGPQGGSDANWKFDRSVNVLEWIYTQDDSSVLGESVKYSLDVKKITLAQNKILVEAYVHSKGFFRSDCRIICTLKDDIGSDYGGVSTNLGKITVKRLEKKVTIHCPAPGEYAEIITILLRNDDHVDSTYSKNCGYEGWATLPAFNMKLLPAGEVAE